jgi:hypothetical protein
MSVEEHLCGNVGYGAGRSPSDPEVEKHFERVRGPRQEHTRAMKDVVGSVMKIDPALDVLVFHLQQRHTHHALKVGEHAAEHVLGSPVDPARHHSVSEEIQSLRSLARRSRLLGVSNSSRSLRQLTPGSLLNHVRCRLA